jgi:fluoride ion exporter CrcB/FEX
MSTDSILQIKTTLEWILAGYIGALLRGVLNLLIPDSYGRSINFGIEAIWITLAVPIILHKFPEIARNLPRPLQWAVWLTIGFTGYDLRPLISQ